MGHLPLLHWRTLFELECFHSQVRELLLFPMWCCPCCLRCALWRRRIVGKQLTASHEWLFPAVCLWQWRQLKVHVLFAATMLKLCALLALGVKWAIRIAVMCGTIGECVIPIDNGVSVMRRLFLASHFTRVLRQAASSFPSASFVPSWALFSSFPQSFCWFFVSSWT